MNRILLLAALLPAALQADLIAHYQFENDFTDSAGTNNAAAVTTGTGTVTFSTSVPPLNGGVAAVDIQGNAANRAYVQAPDAAALDITADLTLAAWINPDDFDVAQGGIISKYTNEGGNQRGYNLRMEGQTILFGLSPTGAFLDRIEVVSSLTVPAGAWTHVAATYVPGTSMRIYLNGVEDSGATFLTGSAAPASIQATTGPLRVGLQFAPTNDINYFDGQIDDARVYNEALSDAEIALIGTPPPVTALPVLTPRFTGSQLAIDWTPLEGVTYTLESSETLDAFGFEKTVAGDGVFRTDLFAPGASGRLFIRATDD